MPIVDRTELSPERPVREQAVAVEMIREELLAIGDRVIFREAVHACAKPGLLIGLDDEGRALVGIGIDMHAERPVVRALQEEGEGVESLGRPEPREASGAALDESAEFWRQRFPVQAVHAIREHHQVAGLERREVADLSLEVEIDARFSSLLLEDVEQAFALDRREPDAAAADDLAAVDDGDRIPPPARRHDRGVALLVLFSKKTHRVLREHDAEAKGVTGAVALTHPDAVAGVCLLRENREVEARRPTADHGNVESSRGHQARSGCASARGCTLPMKPSGIPATRMFAERRSPMSQEPGV